jgi:hypothetical protein
MIMLVKEVVYIPWHFVQRCWHPCSKLHIAVTADYTCFVIDLHNTMIYIDKFYKLEILSLAARDLDSIHELQDKKKKKKKKKLSNETQKNLS